MNVFLQHRFEQVKNNLAYGFSVPAGASYEDALLVLDLFKKQLEAMQQEDARLKAEKELQEKVESADKVEALKSE